MKKLLLLLAFTAASLCAQPVVELDMGSRGRLTLYLADGWKSTSSDMAGTVTLNIAPVKEDVNAECTLSITFPEQDRLDTKSRLKLRLEADCARYLEGSVEGKAVGREFSLSTGFGFYCNFTDPELRGKPPEKGNFKVISVGKIHLAANVLVDLSISADGFKDKPYQELLGAIEGMEFKPGK